MSDRTETDLCIISVKHEPVKTLYCYIKTKSLNAGLEETLLHVQRVLIGEYGVGVTAFCVFMS
jgi:hypothetical protein